MVTTNSRAELEQTYTTQVQVMLGCTRILQCQIWALLVLIPVTCWLQFSAQWQMGLWIAMALVAAVAQSLRICYRQKAQYTHLKLNYAAQYNSPKFDQH